MAEATKYYEVYVRGQHSRGSSANRFGGPDTYVAVTACPEGIQHPKYLRRDRLRARGIDYKYFGEGYAQHTGPRSALGRAIAAAEEYADWKNRCEQAWAEPIR